MSPTGVVISDTSKWGSRESVWVGSNLLLHHHHNNCCLIYIYMSLLTHSITQSLTHWSSSSSPIIVPCLPQMVQLQIPGQNCPHVIREPKRVQHGQQGEQRRVQGVREPRLDRDRVVREAAVSARRIVYNKYLQEKHKNKHSLDGLASSSRHQFDLLTLFRSLQMADRSLV